MAGNAFFEVVPETTTTEHVEEIPSEVPSKLLEQARQDGFTDTVIDRAATMYTKDCKSYSQFLGVLSQAISSIEEDEERELMKQLNIRKSIELEIKHLENKNVFELIDRRILQVYNTSSVTSLELVDECQKTFSEAQEEMYKECRFAVYMCMKSDWVKNALMTIMDKWDASMDVKRYVTTYLKRINIPADNYNAGIRSLISYLPENIQNENSPMMYKAFRAVQISVSSGFNGTATFEDDVLNSDVYYNTLLDCRSKNIPLLAAEQLATSVTAKKEGLVPNAGLLLGKVVALKYQLANTFEEAMNEGLGERADEFYENREKKKEEREQKKLERAVKKDAERAQKISDSVKVSAPKKVNPTPQRKVQHKDFNPYIPTWLAFTLGGIVVSLVSLLFGKFCFVIMLVSTSVASYGWFCMDKKVTVGGKPPVLLVLGGYACAVLVLAFRFM